MTRFDFKRLTTRLLAPTVCLVVISMVVLGITLILNQRIVLNNLSKQVAELAFEINEQQRDSLAQIAQKQVESFDVRLRLKIEILASLVSVVASANLYNYETEILERYCKDLSKDEDIQLVYLVDKSGNAVTTFKNEEDREIKKLIDSNQKLEVLQLVKILKATDSVFEYSTDLTYENEYLGKMNILVSKRSSMYQASQMKTEFDKMETVVSSAFKNLIGSVQQQVSVSTTRSGWIGGGVAVFFTVFLVIALIVIIQKNVNPILQCVSMAKEIADGNLKANITLERRDEIGALTSALNRMTGNLGSMIRDINGSVSTLSISGIKMTDSATEMAIGLKSTAERSETVTDAAEQMNDNLHSVAAAMEQASVNLDSVAAGTEEMNSNISEIAKNAELSRAKTQTAVQFADQSAQQVQTLGKSAEEISTVTDTIASISEKTGLLALNATIEAARAGKTGKGFAVVANEIKSLAQKSAESTIYVTKSLKAVQKSTNSMIKGIADIADVVYQVDESVFSISETVSQQKIASGQIAENINQISQGLKSINVNINQISGGSKQVATEIAQVNESAGNMKNASDQVKQSAIDANNLSDRLTELVGKFKV
ncbi:MAG: methyl-accepting chemotaxis protein [Proteobacteria bacterium]|nr:methyl-accepting chemotaxis protein [Pseudomonadota bacterium]